MRAALLFICLACLVTAHVISWDFTAGCQGWTAHQIQDYTAENGILKGHASGFDPQMISPLFEFKTSFCNFVRIRLRSDISGTGELFYTDTTEGPYNGFSASQSVHFNIPKTTDWKTISIRPPWNHLGKIIRLRIDPPGGQHVEIDSIHITEADTSKATTDTEWNFINNAHPDWTQDDDGTHTSPVLMVNPLRYPYVIATIQTDTRARMVFTCTTENSHISNQTARLCVPGKVFHVYPLTRVTSGTWNGEKSMLSLRIVPEFDKPYTLKQIKLTDKLPTVPDIQVISFAAQNFPNRTGKPCELLLRLQNALPFATDLTIRPRFNGTPLPEIKQHLEDDVPVSVHFNVSSDTPVTAHVEADLVINGRIVETVTATPFDITPVPTRHQHATYVPQPVPAKTDYLIGSYYFPGYGKNCAYRGGPLQEWPMLVTHNPWTKPVLGYYDESLPEVVDWQIKWAVEHGINFFLVDWYWDRGDLYLEHWIDAFQKARYRSQFKWAIMWANHNPACKNAREDWLNVTRQWLGKYLKTPEYLWLDGKPVIFIWTTDRIRSDIGSSAKAAELYALANKMAQEAGLPGITFYAMNHPDFKLLKAEGFSGQATYHIWGNGQGTSRDANFFDYKGITDSAEAVWDSREKAAREHGITALNMADTGWDGRPRHRLNSPIIYGRTPAEFKRQLSLLKNWLDRHQQKIALLAPWNEWTEGSYIEPCSDFGFEMLRAVRDVFCQESAPSDDTCPVDINRPSYDQFPEINVQSTYVKHSAWDFKAAQNSLDWRVVDYRESPFITPDGLAFLTGKRDPGFYSPAIRLLAPRYTKAEITIAVDPFVPNAPIEFFWTTANTTWNAHACQTIVPAQDNQFHTYTIDFAESPFWNSTITGFRIDPPTTGQQKVTLQSVRFIPNF